MNAQQCHQHAADCAANAEMSRDGALALEFLTLAGHWRAMAVRQIYFGQGEGPAEALKRPPAAA